jgi:hypothetical protein
MTSKQEELTPAMSRLGEIRDVIAVLAALYTRKQRTSQIHPIADVCTFLLAEFQDAVAAVGLAAKPLVGDPCPVCSISQLDNLLTDCPNCDDTVCERTLRSCQMCMAESGGDCPACCSADIRGGEGCRAKFWGAIPFVSD